MHAAEVKPRATTRLPQRINTIAGAAHALGDSSLLDRKKLALICSQKCPGDAILKTYDFARLVSDSGITIVTGFHSAIERDCLPILFRGPGPIVTVQAQRLSTSRLPREWHKAIDAGRLLLLSPFNKKDKRVTAELAAERNRFVAATSDEMLIPYASPGSKTESLALNVRKSGKRLHTFSNRSGPLLTAHAPLVAPEFFGAAQPPRI